MPVQITIAYFITFKTNKMTFNQNILFNKPASHWTNGQLLDNYYPDTRQSWSGFFKGIETKEKESIQKERDNITSHKNI